MEEAHNESDEGGSSSPEESDDASTTSSEIRRHLGPVSDPRFIIANCKWLEKHDPELSHLSIAMPMSSYSFEVPNEMFAILSATRVSSTLTNWP